VERLEVLDRGRTPEIEQIPGHAEVARLVAFAGSGVSQGVLDGDVSPQGSSANHGLLELAESVLLRLVLRDCGSALTPTSGWASHARRSSRSMPINGLSNAEE
jgi:hypothetical protein